MSTRFLLKFATGCALVCLAAGCAHCCKGPAVAAPVVSGFPPPAVRLAPVPVNPSQSLPQRPPETPPPAMRMYPPEWRAVPEDPAPRTEPPPAAPEPESPRARLLPPETGATPRGSESPAASSPALPVGIPQFAMAKDRVAVGLKPLLDGLDWLQGNGYRAVLHLRAPGQDDAADRREVEKRGLKYVSLELAPQTLTRNGLDEFSRLVAEPTLQPLFVYDRDGRLAGGVWYLHFRLADKAGDELARSKASRLGLREETDPEQRALWLAIHKLLSDASP